MLDSIEKKTVLSCAIKNYALNGAKNTVIYTS